jgi:mRNA-degrading endonuclease RelE of RelBE toxin-antitoxin system
MVASLSAFRTIARWQEGETYRIVYRIDEAARIVHVLDIDHRSDIYHRPDA